MSFGNTTLRCGSRKPLKWFTEGFARTELVYQRRDLRRCCRNYVWIEIIRRLEVARFGKMSRVLVAVEDAVEVEPVGDSN